MQPGDFIEANRRMWNETADIHAQGYVARAEEHLPGNQRSAPPRGRPARDVVDTRPTATTMWS